MSTPQLPHDVVCCILRHLGPTDWRTASLVSHDWAVAGEENRKKVRSIAIHQAARTSALSVLVGTAKRSSLFTSSPMTQLVQPCVRLLDGDGKLSVATLVKVLRAFSNVRDLRLVGVRLRGEPIVDPGAMEDAAFMHCILAILMAAPTLEGLVVESCLAAIRADRRRTSGLPRALDASFPHLRVFKWSKMGDVGDEVASWLVGRSPGLVSLDLSESECQLPAPPRLPERLEHLNLDGCFSVAEDALHRLLESGALSALTSLVLPMAMPFELALLACSRLPRLVSLSSWSATARSGHGSVTIAHAALRTLALPDLYVHRRSGVHLSVACPQLQGLDLSHGCTMGGGLASLSLCTPALARLNLGGNTACGLGEVGTLRALRTAHVDGCSALTEAMLLNLLRAAPELEHLGMDGCHHLRATTLGFVGGAL